MKYILTIFAGFIFLTSAVLAQDAGEVDFVIEFFDELQPKSIADNKEYCGYFGINDQDEFVATEPTRGEQDSCFSDEPPLDMDIFASYHTHGAFSYDADTELPSSNDMEADIAEEVDGYISTPGGRIWFTDSLKEISIMVCGRNCTVSDDEYEEDALPPVLNRYDLELLYERDEMD